MKCLSSPAMYARYSVIGRLVRCVISFGSLGARRHTLSRYKGIDRLGVQVALSDELMMSVHAKTNSRERHQKVPPWGGWEQTKKLELWRMRRAASGCRFQFCAPALKEESGIARTSVKCCSQVSMGSNGPGSKLSEINPANMGAGLPVTVPSLFAHLCAPASGKPSPSLLASPICPAAGWGSGKI
jgi:hypothetical protein